MKPLHLLRIATTPLKTVWIKTKETGWIAINRCRFHSVAVPTLKPPLSKITTHKLTAGKLPRKRMPRVF